MAANRKAQKVIDRQKNIEEFSTFVAKFIVRLPTFHITDSHRYIHGADEELRVERTKKLFYSVRLLGLSTGDTYEFKMDADKYSPSTAYDYFIDWIAKLV